MRRRLLYICSEELSRYVTGQIIEVKRRPGDAPIAKPAHPRTRATHTRTGVPTRSPRPFGVRAFAAWISWFVACSIAGIVERES
jgi:hypothetical protein